MNSPPPSRQGSLDETNEAIDTSTPEIVALLDQYLEQLKQGEAPNREDFISQHPRYAEQLKACLASLDFLTRERDELLGDKEIGDFRILGEIGRGGMGTVYEAEQISLGRRVALKVIRAGRQTQEAIDRFQREAETVAGLHHTNIVPIFSVGAEAEINYFAMQLIDGKSLSEVARESEEPIPPRQVAKWGLGIVDALAHAHSRGIVHRDVKPSNVLLDNDGNVWLSDFGLAKRSDDLTLSVSGAILGTPRYMSPEQARGAVNEVDQRSDIYSVGATLYELATKSPVFDADSPHKVISQIIHNEPASPRTLNTAIPRDLDTILTKCLRKNPSERYSSANDLADDLRAFLNDREISAQPDGLLQHGTRWLRKKRSSFVNFLLAASATILIALLGYGFEYWRQLRGTADYLLAADVPGAVAEIFDDSGVPVREPVSLPTSTPITLRGGDYSVRVSAPGRFSVTKPVKAIPQTYASLNYHQEQTISVSLNSRLAGPPIRVERAYGILPGRGLVLSLSDLGVSCIDFRTGQTVWTSPVESWQEHTESIQQFRWKWQKLLPQDLYAPNTRAPNVVASVGDLDLDGIDDFLLAGKYDDWIIAFSTASGKPIWASVLGTHQDQQLAGAPLIIPDIDGDGVQDIVAVSELPFVAKAISGKTGETIWEGDIDLGDKYATYHSYQSAPAGAIPAKSVLLRDGKIDVRPHPAQMVTVDGQDSVLVVVGKLVWTLDLTSGKKVHSGELPVMSNHLPIVRDMDGDSSSDLVVTDMTDKRARRGIVAWSIKRGAVIFDAEPAKAASPKRRFRSHARHPNWPQFVDLDANGSLELLQPSTTNPHHSIEATELTRQQHQDHKRLWQKLVDSEEEFIHHFLSGPDINRDGYRDVFAATLWNYDRFRFGGYRSKLFVDAFSGKDGETLWSSHADLQSPTERITRFKIHQIKMWHQTDSEFPQIVVSVHPDTSANSSPDYKSVVAVRPVTFSFYSSTGALKHRANNVANVDIFDVDGDDIDDLVGYGVELFGDREAQHQLSIITGKGKRLWHNHGGYPQPIPSGDLDGDGVGDVVQTHSYKAARAVSGANGATLWETSASKRHSRTHEIYRPPNDANFDADQDGVPDLLWVGYPIHQWGNQPLVIAVSGANGKTLWESSTNVVDANKLSLIEFKDLDGDGVQELILVGPLEVGPERRSSNRGLSHSYAVNYPLPGLTMVVMDQRTGKAWWHQKLGSEGQPYLKRDELTLEIRKPNETFEFDIDFVDVDKDGVLDIISPRENARAETFDVCVLDGKTGKSSDAIAPFRMIKSLRELPRITTANLDGRGANEIIFSFCNPATRTVRLLACDLGGKIVWKRDFKNKTAATNPDARSVARLHNKDGSPYFAIDIRKWQQESVVEILDAAGETFGKSLQLTSVDDEKCFRVIDIDHDNEDELVAFDKGMLKAFDIFNDSAVLWERELINNYEEGSDLDLRFVPSSHKDELVIHNRTENYRMFAVDKRSGNINWNCPLDAGSRPVVVTSKDQPHVMVQNTDYTMAVYQPARAKGNVDRTIDSHENPRPVTDIRHRRYLPWANIQLQNWIRFLPTAIAWATFNTTALLIIPGWFVSHLVAKRRWSMRLFLLLPVVASISFLDLIIFRETGLVAKLTMAAIFAPFVAFFVRQIHLIRSQRWWRVVLWSLVATLACVPMVLIYWVQTWWLFQPGDYLAMDRWYLGVLVGTWGAGLIIAIQMLCTWLHEVWKSFLYQGDSNVR